MNLREVLYNSNFERDWVFFFTPKDFLTKIIKIFFCPIDLRIRLQKLFCDSYQPAQKTIFLKEESANRKPFLYELRIIYFNQSTNKIIFHWSQFIIRRKQKRKTFKWKSQCLLRNYFRESKNVPNIYST